MLYQLKASGLYQEIINSLSINGIEYAEFSGIEPNPKHTTINDGIKKVREMGEAVIIAAGGGYTIDTGKAIGFGYYGEDDVWDFYCGKKKVEKTLPVIYILRKNLTLACGMKAAFLSLDNYLEYSMYIINLESK